MNLEPERKHPSLTWEHILSSATKLVMADGATALTLDAVAKAAGISKGGLLYHFPSKEALILGMIDSRHEWLMGVILEEKKSLPEPDAVGAWHKAFVLAGFKNFITCLDLTAGVLATVAQVPIAVQRIQSGVQEFKAALASDGVPRVVSNAIWACVDGIKMHRVMGLALPSDQEIDELRNLLLDMIDQAVQSTAPSSNSRESA